MKTYEMTPKYDIERLVEDAQRVLPYPIFEDSYGNGVVEYNGQSVTSWGDLAELAGLNELKYWLDNEGNLQYP